MRMKRGSARNFGTTRYKPCSKPLYRNFEKDRNMKLETTKYIKLERDKVKGDAFLICLLEVLKSSYK